VIERAEFIGGVRVGVEERGDEDANLVAEDLANESNAARRDGDFVVERVLFAGGGQGDDLLPQAGSDELLDDFEVEVIHAHAKMESSLQQGGEEPTGRVPAVEQQQVVVAKFVEVFEKHLPLADVGRIELGGQGHFDPGQIEREPFRLDPVASRALAVARLAEQGQLQVCGIAGDEAQTMPKRKAEVLLDQDEEMIVEQREGGGRHLHPGFGKGLRGDFPDQVGAVRQVGEERVQFRLDFGRVSADQAGDQARKTEPAGSGEGLLRQTRLDEKRLRKQEIGERVNDVDIKILAYKTLPLYQGKIHFPRSPLVLQPLLLLPADAVMRMACYVESIASRPPTYSIIVNEVFSGGRIIAYYHPDPGSKDELTFLHKAKMRMRALRQA
jgi:hypothetical protein